MELRYCLTLVLVCGVGCGKPKPKQEPNIGWYSETRTVLYMKHSWPAFGKDVAILKPGECAVTDRVEVCVAPEPPSNKCVQFSQMQCTTGTVTFKPNEPTSKP